MKTILSALILILSFQASAFDAATAKIDEAYIYVGLYNPMTYTHDGRTYCNYKHTSETPATVVIRSYDDQLNSRTVKAPVVIRSKAVGLLCKAGSNEKMKLVGLAGKSLSSIYGIYEGGRTGAGLSTAINYGSYSNGKGIVISDFEELAFGFGIEVSSEKIVIARPDEVANVSINVTSGTNDNATFSVPMEQALKDIAF